MFDAEPSDSCQATSARPFLSSASTGLKPAVLMPEVALRGAPSVCHALPVQRLTQMERSDEEKPLQATMG